MSAVRHVQPADLLADVTAAIAAWLAGVFIAALTAESVREQSVAGGSSLLAAMGDALGCHFWTDRMEAALQVGGSPAATERYLGQAYTRLFEGVDGPATVPLYESAYGASTNRLFQAATGDMESLLQRRGLAITREWREPPDHLSVELALLASVLRADDRPGIRLVSGRLGNWIPRFCARCVLGDTTGYYGGAAMMLNYLAASPALQDARRTHRTSPAPCKTPTS